METETKPEKIEQGKVEIDRTSLEKYVQIWKKYDGTYFWHPDGNARGRRKAEEDNTFEHNFSFDGHKYTINVSMSQSCHHVYVTRMLTRDGKRVTIRALTKYLE